MSNRLEQAEKRLEQAKAQVQRARAAEAQKERKADTRRKVIIGGYVLAKARVDPRFWQFIQNTVAEMSEKDRAAFEGWMPPPRPAEPEATVNEDDNRS